MAGQQPYSTWPVTCNPIGATDLKPTADSTGIPQQQRGELRLFNNVIE